MSIPDWKVPSSAQPKPQRYAFDLDRALSSVMMLTSTVPPDAFTAETLGTERAGNAVLIREDGIVLTIGYLTTEATSIWLTLNDGRVVPGHPLAVDGRSGFGLVQALGPIDVPPLRLGSSSSCRIGDDVVVAGAGGRKRSVAARITSVQEFAGYWEYVLDEAIFTAPAHPHWGGTALIGAGGELLGIGSLQIGAERSGKEAETLNMSVPIDLLTPVFDDLLRFGRPGGPARPWLGLYATEVEDRIAIAGTAPGGPAEKAGLQVGDVVLAVAAEPVRDLAGFFRQVWQIGEAGATIPLRIGRENRVKEVAVASTERDRMLKRPVLH